jgi:hypothetical protein
MKFKPFLVISICACLIALELVTGIIRYAYIENTTESLTETGLRVRYFERLCNAGLLGRNRARSYALNHFKRNPHYGQFFLLLDRSLWAGYSRKEMRSILGTPFKEGEDYDVWKFTRTGSGDDTQTASHMAVEYENETYARMGFPYGGTPSDDDRANASYRLKRDYGFCPQEP